MKVGISTYRDRLRLTWTWEGKRHFLSLGLQDTKLNRIVAEGKARQIEADLVSGNFDHTLNKYKLQKPGAPEVEALTVVEVFDKFIEHKSKRVEERTLEKYYALAKLISAHFKRRSLSITERDAERFREFLLEQMEPITVKERITLLAAAYDWATKQGWATENPWKSITVKVAPKQRPKPFTKTEVKAIIQAFREDATYHYMADYVEFLFLTGCRTGEAIGLLWKHISDDYRSVWIGEVLSRGKRKSTKTNKDRVVQLSPRLQELLRERRGDRGPNELVFCGPRGNAIDDHNFRNRAWEPILERLGIEYRKPYATRSTMISHNLAAGRNPIEIAQITGHDPKVMYQHYAGVIASHPAVRDVYD